MQGFDLPPQVPSKGRAFQRAVNRLILRLAGWRFAGMFPDLPRFVVIVAPHTSNWDFAILVIAKFALGIDVVWIGKESIFRWPVAGWLRALGGIPVDRHTPRGIVQQLVDEFGARERMVFALAPEGTRKRVEQWRSGYWHVAHDARVPIVPVGLDYSLKTIFIGPPRATSESLEDDERELRGYFAGIVARHPEKTRGREDEKTR